MRVDRLEHVQLAMPAGGEALARAFYGGILEIPEIPESPNLAARGGCWFERDDMKIHLGVESEFRPARKAHPALVVADWQVLVSRLKAAGHPVREDELELMERARWHGPMSKHHSGRSSLTAIGLSRAKNILGRYGPFDASGEAEEPSAAHLENHVLHDLLSWRDARSERAIELFAPKELETPRDHLTRIAASETVDGQPLIAPDSPKQKTPRHAASRRRRS